MDWQTFLRALPAALGWMIAHSLWQIAVLFVSYRLVARIWKSDTQVQYAAALVAMGLSAIGAVCTLVSVWPDIADSVVFDTASVPAMFITTPPVGADGIRQALPQLSAVEQFRELYGFWATPVGLFWSLGVTVLSLRLAGGRWMARRLRTRGVSPVPEHRQQQCRDWSERLGIRRPVRWLESTRIAEPLTLGFWKPVVLFPAGMLLQLPPDQVEVLLLHELAHIRRHDYFVNLVQLILEVCFFYHPLFWLLSRAARRHREFACDDLVVRHTANPLLYAKTLTNLQLSIVNHPNPFVMYALGKSAFAQRIYRIAGLKQPIDHRQPWFPVLFLIGSLTAGALWSSFTVKNDRPEPAELSVMLPEEKPAVAPLPAVPLVQPSPTPVVEAAAPDTLSPGVVAIEATKMNVFYIGVDNPITVAVPGYSCDDIKVRLSNGTGELIPLGECQYNVHVTQPGIISVEVFGTDHGREKQLGVKTYRVKRIPDPVPGFDGQESAVVSQTDLEKVFGRELKAIMVNFDFDAQCDVVRFTVACRFSQNSDVVEFPVTGNKIPVERLKTINQVEPNGGKIYLMDVMVKCPGDSNARKIGDMVFKVVN